MSLTAKEVDEKIEEFDKDIYSDLKYGEEIPDVPGLPKIGYVDDFGGEGQGDNYWVVFKCGDQFFRKNGWYASHDGGYLDGDLYEVIPEVVQVVHYTIKENA